MPIIGDRALQEETEHMKKARRAYEALLGKRNDVYPCIEDVPAELWGEPIHQTKIK